MRACEHKYIYTTVAVSFQTFYGVFGSNVVLRCFALAHFLGLVAHLLVGAGALSAELSAEHQSKLVNDQSPDPTAGGGVRLPGVSLPPLH